MIVRKRVPILRRLYIPGSVIAGFLILLLLILWGVKRGRKAAHLTA